jgi:hypothetical protein
MLKPLYLALGMACVALAVVGIFLPLVPTVPFLLLGAFFFSKGSKRMETWLVEHPRLGPPIRAWREKGSISRGGRRAAYAGFALSGLLGFFLLPMPWRLLPPIVAVIGSAWIHTRPKD